MTDHAATVLRVEKFVTGYGVRPIVHQVDLEVRAGEVVAVIGHNGAGKSTLLKGLFGLLPAWSGNVAYPRVPGGTKPRALLRGGVAYVPQGNRVFPRLTVLENLQLSAVVLQTVSRRKAAVEGALELFPALRGRETQRAGTLSGGEKQMLALACAMSLKPHLLLLDEPTLGLSPALVKAALNRIAAICADANVGCLVVEQKVHQVLRVSDRVYALKGGAVAFAGASADLADERKLREVYL